MVYNCLVVEDEPLARDLLSQYIRKVPFLNLLKACSNPLEAIEILSGRVPTEGGQAIDIVFLDVQMPEITGITLLKIVQKKPYIILTTAYSEYALEGYELDVTDYLLKPITFERFLKAAERAAQKLGAAAAPPPPVAPLEKTPVAEPAPAFIFVKDGTKLIKVRFADILYVEGLKDYVVIHTKEQKIVTLQRLKTLETQLPEAQFIRIHNSYIVALEWIDAIHKERVQIGKVFLPISDTYRKKFKDFIDQSYFS